MESEADTYIYWLRTTDLELATLEDRLQAVNGILQNLASEKEENDADEALISLKQILANLQSGDLSTSLIEAFRQDFLQDIDEGEPEHEQLENELRQIAAGLPPELWASEIYQNFAGAITDYRKGGDEQTFWDTVEDIEEIIEEAHNTYSNTSILPKEVTLESQVVNDLLLEAIEGWRNSLLAISGNERDEEPEWEEILALAEGANRLLIAIQIYNKQLQDSLDEV